MTATAPQTITPKQAIAAIQNISQQIADPAAQQQALVALANTIAFSSPSWAISGMQRDAALLKELGSIKSVLITVVKQLKLAGADPAAAEVATDGQGLPTDTTPQPRVDQNGNPMDPHQAALEDMMDSATAGMPANPNAPAPNAGDPFAPQAATDVDPNNFPPMPDQETPPTPAAAPAKKARANGATSGPAAPKA